MNQRRNSSHEKGYAMIIIAALLSAFMAVVGSVLESNTVDEQIRRQEKAREQLSVLAKALEQYAAFNNHRYPCPARADLAYGDATFGAAITGCHTGALNTGGLTGIRGLPDDTAGSEVVRGMIPVRALAPYGLTLEDAFDPWGTRIMYVVNRTLTLSGNGVPTTGPTLTETLTNTVLSNADYLLISYGKDRVGGVVRSQTTTLTATASCPASSAKIREENCDNDLTFIRRPIFIHTSATDTNYFDDIITGYAGASITNCVATNVYWNGNCSYTLTANMPNGSSLVVPNSAASYVGSATVSCNAGSLVISNNFCQPTGATCTWATAYNTWNGTTDCNNIPGWASAPICASGNPCNTITNTVGSTITYSSASTNCTDAMCRENSTCTTNYGGSTNTATSQIRVCRPNAGCAAGAHGWNTNCSGSYPSSAVGGTVNVTNTAIGYTGSISGTCQANGTISWAGGSCGSSSCTLPWGGTINDGQSVTAYQSAAPVGGACTSQTRTCSNGSLSGSYTNQSCSAGCTITYDGSSHTVAHGASVTRYAASSCATVCYQALCEFRNCCDTSRQEATCSDGTVYGTNPITYTSTTCSTSTGFCGCFSGDTKVTMADGSTKRIAELKAGDLVRGQSGNNRVLRVPVRETSQKLYGFNGDNAFVTGGHPFYTTEGWKAFDPSLTPEEFHRVETQPLDVGDTLTTDSGSAYKITSVTTEMPAKPVKVYNPMVDGDHTYFANHKLVHNKVWENCN